MQNQFVILQNYNDTFALLYTFKSLYQMEAYFIGNAVLN